MLPASQLYSLVCNGSIIVNFNCDYCMVIDTNSIATQMHDISVTWALLRRSAH